MGTITSILTHPNELLYTNIFSVPTLDILTYFLENNLKILIKLIIPVWKKFKKAFSESMTKQCKSNPWMSPSESRMTLPKYWLIPLIWFINHSLRRHWLNYFEMKITKKSWKKNIMINFSNHPANYGATPLPCTTRGCHHPSRAHKRSKQQLDGSWNGPCTKCDCRLYQKPKLIKVKNWLKLHNRNSI